MDPPYSPGGSRLGAQLRARAWSYSGPSDRLLRSTSAPPRPVVAPVSPPLSPPLSHYHAYEGLPPQVQDSQKFPNGQKLADNRPGPHRLAPTRSSPSAYPLSPSSPSSMMPALSLSPRYLPSSPSSNSLIVPQLQRRGRSLSETGRKLFYEVYEGDLLDASLASTSWKQPLKVQANGHQEVKSKGKKGHKSSRREERVAEKTDSNPFAAFGSDEDDDEDRSVFDELVHRNSFSHVNPRELYMRSAGVPPPNRIEESVIGEDENEMSEWETVPKKTKKKKTPKQDAAASKEEQVEDVHSYMTDDSDGFDDLFDLQAKTFGSRQVGKAKKTQQFKAAEKRGYAIDKRNRQRAGG